MIDLNDHPEYAEALAAADKACERAARGIPPDRYASTEQMVAIFSTAIPALYALPYAVAAEAFRAGYDAACKERGTASIKMEGE